MNNYFAERFSNYNPCEFDRNRWYSIGKKISGNAQFTNTKSMFSHGTLLFDSHIEDVVKALNVKAEKIESKGIKSVKSRVSNIKPFLKSEMTIYEFKRKIIENSS